MLIKMKNDDLYDAIIAAQATVNTAQKYQTIPLPMQMEYSFLDQYPITNKNYKQFENDSELPDVLYNLTLNCPAISAYFQKAKRLLTGKKFIGNLLQVRDCGTINDTYDPWYRSISHQQDKYCIIDKSVGYPVGTFYRRMQKFQIKVGANSEDVLLFWVLSSTIIGNPIEIFLYTFATFDYVNSKKLDAHIQSIHPYRINTSKSYDLTRPQDA